MKAWVYLESDGPDLSTASKELLTYARSLGTCEGVYVGKSDVSAPAGEHGASSIFMADPGDGLVGAAAGHLIAALANEHSPDLVLFAQSYDGRDAVAVVSATLDRPVVTNASGILIDDAVKVNSQIFGGTLTVTTTLTAEAPALVAVRPKSFSAEPAGLGPAEVVRVPIPDFRGARVVDSHAEDRTGPKLEDAAVVVSGGRGLGSAEGYGLVEQLAKLLNGATGASRAIVDAGWVPYSKQVGQTGKTVKPNVYFALGISGATQHVVGMKNSSHIIAVNKDPDAPIFSLADLGIVGDVHQVVPALISALQSS